MKYLSLRIRVLIMKRLYMRRVFCADFGAAGLKFSSFFVVAFACVFMVFQRDKMYS